MITDEESIIRQFFLYIIWVIKRQDLKELSSLATLSRALMRDIVGALNQHQMTSLEIVSS